MDKTQRLMFAFGLERFYLTRAVYSPASDPGKPVLGSLSVCPGLFGECTAANFPVVCH